MREAWGLYVEGAAVAVASHVAGTAETRGRSHVAAHTMALNATHIMGGMCVVWCTMHLG